VQQLQEFAEQEGVPFDPEGWNRDRDYLVNQVKAEVAQRLYNGREYLWRVLIEGDAVVDSAVARMGDAAALHAKAEALSENG
jgi:hypothetical protein